MPRFTSGGKVYEMATLDEATPRDILTFRRDATEVMNRPIRYADLEQMGREIDGLPDDEKESHPDFDFVMTVAIWISRRAAGENLTYAECLDAPFAMLPDEPSGKAPAAKKAAKKAPGKKRSGNPAVRAAAE